MSSRRSQQLAATLEARSGAINPTFPPPVTPTTPTPTVMARPSSDPRNQPVGDLLQQFGSETKTLITEELQLAKTEMTSKVKTAGQGAGLLGGAAVVGIFAFGALTAGLILALALVMPAWLAALVVGVAYGLVAGGLALAGKGKVKDATPLVPEQTVRTLGHLSNKLQGAWRRGQAR